MLMKGIFFTFSFYLLLISRGIKSLDCGAAQQSKPREFISLSALYYSLAGQIMMTNGQRSGWEASRVLRPAGKETLQAEEMRIVHPQRPSQGEMMVTLRVRKYSVRSELLLFDPWNLEPRPLLCSADGVCCFPAPGIILSNSKPNVEMRMQSLRSSISRAA